MKYVITIDGPAASGKSTVSKKAAKHLEWLYVDSGALYRGITWVALLKDINCADGAAVGQLADTVAVEFEVRDGAVSFNMDGRDPGMEIRSRMVDNNVSLVAAVPSVRKKVVQWLRNMASLGSLVVEGRDIGTVVFPDAFCKFYLDASSEERARRRHKERLEIQEVSIDEIETSLKRRDSIDSTRKSDPLRVADGAFIVDTTSLSLDEVVDIVVDRVKICLKGLKSE